MAILSGLAGPVLATDVGVHTAYRMDEFHFKLPFALPLPGGSELRWQSLESIYTSLEISSALSSKWEGRLDIGYGPFLAGEVTDRDWLDQTGTFSFTEHDADQGGVTEFGARAVTSFWKGDLSLGFDFQRLDMHVLEKGSKDVVPGGRTFRGLNTTYDAFSNELVVGYGTRRREQDGFAFRSLLEIGAGYYYAEANWNLRTDFAHPISFTQEGISVSLKTRLEPAYRWKGRHEVGLRVDGGVYTVLNPVERLYLATGLNYEGELDQIAASHAALGAFYRYSF